MNTCFLTGRLTRPAVGFSEGKILKFILATGNQSRESQTQRRISYVPCVIFEPSKELEHSLIASSSTKAQWEMQGRVVRNAFDGAPGERRYSTEVVIDPATVCQVKG